MLKQILLFLALVCPAFCQTTGNAGSFNFGNSAAGNPPMYNISILDNLGIGTPKDGNVTFSTITAMMAFEDSTNSWCIQGNVWTTADMTQQKTLTPNTTSPGCTITTTNKPVANQSLVGYVNYNNANGGDYRLCHGPNNPSPLCTAASPYANAASDGKDVGADINLVNQAIAGVQ